MDSSSKSKFKVIIVGGGIAGLTLAKSLELLDIDYVLLESHRDIAPAVGASIGLQANGLRILDQIGCYDAIKEAARGSFVKHTYLRTLEGTTFSKILHLDDHLQTRWGYPMIFMDRQWMLQAVADKIQRKDSIILNRRVKKIEQLSEDGVSVTTTDGSTYTGDLVVGADGIHSVVRAEMLRIASETRPGYFDPKEEDRVPCFKCCIFGISREVEGWPEHVSVYISGSGVSFLVASGPERRCYWFVFVQLPETKYGKEIPRYTKQDEALLADKYANARIMESVTFGEIYAKRFSSTLTPLHEVVFDKWCFERMVLIGDSVHKPDPINGMGGNNAVETAAELLNVLVKARDRRPGGLNGLTTREIESISLEVQRARKKRAKGFISAAHMFQAVLVQEDWIKSKILINFVLPFTRDLTTVDQLGMAYAGASRIRVLPLPECPRVEPFNDELPAKPIKPRIRRDLRLVLLSGILFLGAVRQDSHSGRHVFTFSREYKVFQLIAPLMIYTIERYRDGGPCRMFGLRNMSIAAMQTTLLPVNQTAALWAMWNTIGDAMSCRPAGRRVDPEVAQALIPALTVGYLLPALMKLSPISWEHHVNFWDHPICHSWVLLFPFLTVLFSAFFRWSGRFLSAVRRQRIITAAGSESQKNSEPKPHLGLYKSDDLMLLQAAYGFTFLTTTAAHFLILRDHCFLHLIQISQPITSAKLALTLMDGVSKLPLAALGAVICHSLLWVWELRCMGYVTDREATRAALLVTVGQVVVGPGATLVALWSWRESLIAGLSTLGW
ncbi:hypothetical protein QBC44DRAFT_399988 [Cladorrhinum sp. PSN332]|nr:hypothetical protein QBC44DRAFT_399988 [Cladorrhinum sp. PSN332]